MENQPRDESRAATVREGGAESWTEAGEFIDQPGRTPTAAGSRTPTNPPTPDSPVPRCVARPRPAAPVPAAGSQPPTAASRRAAARRRAHTVAATLARRLAAVG